MATCVRRAQHRTAGLLFSSCHPWTDSIWYVQFRFSVPQIDWLGNPFYCVDVVTNGQNLKVQGEEGVLSFLADTNYKLLKRSFDSLLLVCGLGTRNARDPALFAWLRRVAPTERR